jgi:DNA-binding transcriptional MocR family regulator
MDELEDLMLRYRPKMLYTNPTFQNPSGTTLPIRARRELIQLAQRYRVPIVEDETYCQLSLGQAVPPALHALDEEGSVVIRVNSFSKVLAPGLRLGWVGASKPIIEQLALMKQQVDPHTQNLIQFVVSQLIDGGQFDRHLTTLRIEHRRRRDSMLKALQKYTPPGALRLAVPEGGLFFWCRLTGPATARDVQQRALAEGVAIVTGEPFYTDNGGTKDLRICFTNRTPDVGVMAAKVIGQSVAASNAQAERAQPLGRIV